VYAHAHQAVPTILIVDDDEVLSQVVGRALSRSGYRIMRAGNVADAGRRMADAADLALLDLNLPDGDGVELATTLQTLRPGLPAVLMTGCPFRFRPHGPAGPFTRVLTKPLDLTGLREAVRTALTEGPYARANAS
jgi:DNA-binding response OmpR family regulator